MNLDELKSSWQALDEQILAGRKLSENLALSLMKDRSKSTLVRIQKELGRMGLFFSALLGLFCTVLLGNPFDYTGWPEYIPAVLYTLLALFAVRTIWKEYQDVRAVTLTRTNLRESLQSVVRLHERYLKTMGTLWKVSLVTGYLFSLSLFARHFDQYGPAKFAWLAGGQLATVAVLYGLARWFFARLPDPHLTELKDHLRELDELA